LENGHTGDILVQKSPACTLSVLAQAVKEIFHADNPIRTIGIRHGEKMFETLLTNEECARAVDMGAYFRVPADSRDLNYEKYYEQGNAERSRLSEFNSSNRRCWMSKQVKERLLKLAYIRAELDSFRN
jgi:UDP-glucose 4-epimerase